VLKDFPAFSSTPTYSSFYHQSPEHDLTFEICGHGHASKHACNHVAAINLVAAVCGFVVLSFQVHDDDEETLNTPTPIQMFWHLAETPAKRSAPWARSLVWRGSVGLLMTCALACRDLLVPALVLGGTAMALAGADTAQDIVLNSLAAGFIFDLDGNLYRWVFARRHADRYQSENFVLPALVSNDADVVRHWDAFTGRVRCSLYVLNIALCLLFYVIHISPGTKEWPRPTSNDYFWLQLYLHARVLCFVAAQVYMRAKSHLFLTNRPDIVKYLVIFTVGGVGQSYFAHQLVFYGLVSGFGSLSTFYVPRGSPMEGCLMETMTDCEFPVRSFDLAGNHTQPGPSYTYDAWYGSNRW